MAKLKIKQVRSPIGKPKTQKRILRALGLKHINDVVEHDDKPEIRGMVEKIAHLIEVDSSK